jgi:hypothetical protein
MMKKNVLISILALLLGATLSEGADWLYFIENRGGDKLYIDMESIQRTSSHRLTLKKKVEPANSADISSLISEIEMDCKDGRIKLLTNTTYFINGKIATGRGNGEFQKITDKDIDESLLELVCSLKKAE